MAFWRKNDVLVKQIIKNNYDSRARTVRRAAENRTHKKCVLGTGFGSWNPRLGWSEGYAVLCRYPFRRRWDPKI